MRLANDLKHSFKPIKEMNHCCYPFTTFPGHADTKGSLSFNDQHTALPFVVKRSYWIYNVPELQTRGGHAHKSGEQIIVCLSGEVMVRLESKERETFEYRLRTPKEGLYIPPMWWGEMIFQDNALLLGLASDDFAETDYIRNKKEFYG